jgi:methylated-DNA-[protein]-cysteine S-methyltransferase
MPPAAHRSIRNSQSSIRNLPTCFRVFSTPCGRFAVLATAEGLARVYLPSEAAKLPAPSARAAVDPKAAAFAAQADREIRDFLAGRRRDFTVPLDTRALPPFHHKALLAARRIPYGRTLTYGALAARVGSPRASRAVGQAMARNPLPLVLPCHRVVATGGGLGGYGGGLPLKRRLLALESAES